MTRGPGTIRPAREDDADAIVAIYAPLVRDSHVTFETEPPTEAEVRARIRDAAYPWRVLEDGDGVAAYGCGSVFRARPAYRRTVEASVYVDPARRGRGVGTALGGALLEVLAGAGFHSAVGVVALPNSASEALLRRLGFRRAGVLREAGFKLERWWDVAIWQRALEGSGSEARSADGGHGDPPRALEAHDDGEAGPHEADREPDQP